MLVLLVPPMPGDSETFSITTWNIRSCQGMGLAAAAKGLHQMGHQSQPDYCMARELDIGHFCNMAYWQPRIHNLDHWAVVAFIWKGRLASLSMTTRGAKLSTCISLLWRIRMHRHVYLGNHRLLTRWMCQCNLNTVTGSWRKVGG